MKANLKGIFSIDLPGGPPELPLDPEDCWVMVEADIGGPDGIAADEFTFYVCTLKKLSKVLSSERYQFGRHMLIVERFDWEIVERAIASICAQAEGDTWEEVAGWLNTYGAWEFYRYSPA